MTDTLYSANPEVKARAKRLLLEALNRAEIPEHDKRSRSGFSDKYWWICSTTKEIEVQLTSINIGWVTLSFFPESFAYHIAQTTSDDETAITHLSEGLRYVVTITNLLLPETNQLLIARRFNQLMASDNPIKEQLKAGYEFLGEPMRRGFEKMRGDAAKRLAGEPVVSRGGSDARLSEDELEKLHVLYDVAVKMGRNIKKDYNKTLKRFARGRASRGYTHKQWHTHWRTHCAENYPEEVCDFAMLFADPDAPSASGVAYQKLAQMTGHKVSYLPGLVTKSRKLAKKQD